MLFAVRKDGFKAHPGLLPELDLVEEEDQFTHLVTLDEVTNAQDKLSKRYAVYSKAFCGRWVYTAASEVGGGGEG